DAEHHHPGRADHRHRPGHRRRDRRAREHLQAPRARRAAHA
ncbi:MAG: RND multidrug efflux transporter; Acriflavin resistance protein, partial [uncultured Solirubrobacterales bacterium]